MASNYSPNMTWPIKALALQKKILGYEGIHVTFENGKRYPNVEFLQAPSPRNKGYTFRVFLYTGDLSGTNFVGIHREIGLLYDGIRMNIKKQTDIHAEMEADWHFRTFAFEGTEKIADRILAHDIYSFGFRVESTGYIALYLDERWRKALNVGTILDVDWRMWMHLQSQFVLSYHFSQETSEPYLEPRRGFMNGLLMYAGSYAEYTLIFNGPGQDLQVGQFGNSVTFSGPATLVPGETVQVIVRVTFAGYILSASFDDKPQYIIDPPPRYLEVVFTGDYSLRKNHTHVAE